MKPIVDRLEETYGDELTIVRVDIDRPAGEKLAREYAGEFLKGRPPGQSNDKLIRAIVDHNLVFPSSLVVVDGVIGMEGQGPWSGDPIKANLLVAGYDLVATDAVAARLMGHDAPEEMPLFRYAAQAGLGDPDVKSVELVGDAFEDLSVAFKRHSGYEAWAEEWLMDREKTLAVP